MLRLFLALILALAAMPMPAMACDDAMPTATSGHHMSGVDHPAPTPLGHDCIGCIAVADWDADRILPPQPVVAPLLTIGVARMALLPGEAPTPPPPRDA